ncbi:MAG: AAA family ATPase [Planctomycetota bacterium]
MRTVAIVNQKGGCGKTTSALSIAGYLAHCGYRTLLVDTDPQGHCAAGLAIPEQRIDLDVGDAMLADDDNPPDNTRLLWRASRLLDLLPARMTLAGLESSRGGLSDRPDREQRLRAALNRLRPDYDACVIDCSPSIGLLTFNALIAADAALIPVDTSFFALQGATRQLSTIAAVARRLGRELPTWVLPTIHDTDSALAEDLLEELRRRFGAKVAPNPVRRDSALREAASFGQPIIDYAPDAPGAQDYAAITQWLIDRLRINRADQPAPKLPTTPVAAPAGEITPKPVSAATIPAESIRSDSAQQLDPSGPDPSDPGQSQGPARAERLAQTTEQLRSHVDRLSGGQTELIEPETPDGTELIEPETPDGAASTQPVRVPTRPATAVRLITDNDRPTEVHPSARRMLGVTITPQGVLFLQPVTAGARLFVAGDFNGWSITSHPLKLNRALGVYECCVPLPEGVHPYKLVVDGRWINDPYNPERVSDGKDGHNTILRVPTGKAATPNTASGDAQVLPNPDANGDPKVVIQASSATPPIPKSGT